MLMAMSKKKLLAVASISILLVTTLTGMQFANVARANPYEPYHFDMPPIISIISPLNNEVFSVNNETSSANIPLNFTIKPDRVWLVGWNDSTGFYKNKLISFNITLNGNVYRSVDVDSDLSSPFNYTENLENLAVGTYNLTIIAHSRGWDLEGHGMWHTEILMDTPCSINFTVNVDAAPPTISSISIQNKTYSKEDLLLTFVTSETSETWFCLDGKENTTISRNVTLTGLPEGIHTLEIYANDTVGNIGHSDLIQFTIDTSTPSPTLAPTVEPTSTPKQQTGFLGTNLPTEYGYAIVGILVIVVVAGLSMVYLKKLRK
jgi:hypothetical protein